MKNHARFHVFKAFTSLIHSMKSTTIRFPASLCEAVSIPQADAMQSLANRPGIVPRAGVNRRGSFFALNRAVVNR